MKLKGQVAIVTGAGRNIGEDTAKLLALEGAKIAVVDFDKERGDKVAFDINSSGGQAQAFLADISNEDDIAKLMQDVVALWGGIDILVNNAGIQHVSPIEDFPNDKWDDVIAINLSSAFHTTRLALPGMRSTNWGRIINISSVHGLVGSANKSAYVAAKHGIVGLTKVTALETATTGVTCNAICPGWVLTPLVQKQVDARAKNLNISDDEAKRQLLSEKEPSMQFTTPDELGELALFFCSPAGKNVRGVAWNMDGGWTAQ
jgi:3-hydroxybutyrate dehydrogenase